MAGAAEDCCAGSVRVHARERETEGARGEETVEDRVEGGAHARGGGEAFLPAVLAEIWDLELDVCPRSNGRREGGSRHTGGAACA